VALFHQLFQTALTFISRDLVKVRLVLIKDGVKVGEILADGVKNDPAGLVKQLVEKLKPVIDGLLPQ
jgi:hypothetical protein